MTSSPMKVRENGEWMTGRKIKVALPPSHVAAYTEHRRCTRFKTHFAGVGRWGEGEGEAESLRDGGRGGGRLPPPPAPACLGAPSPRHQMPGRQGARGKGDSPQILVATPQGVRLAQVPVKVISDLRPPAWAPRGPAWESPRSVPPQSPVRVRSAWESQEGASPDIPQTRDSAVGLFLLGLSGTC